MPVLNRADTLEKAICSVLEQQYENLEFLIIDGGSTDGTVDIIKRYEKHLAFWHSKPDGNAIIATNIGITKATGELIAIFMADDWYEQGTFHRIAYAYQTNPDADIITCGGRIVNYDEKNQAYKTILSYTQARKLELTFYNICFAVSAICCRFIKHSLYERIGLFKATNSAGRPLLTNDKEFLLRAMLQKVKNIYVDHLGHTYFAHPLSFSFASDQPNAERHCAEHMEIAEDYLQKHTLTWKERRFFIYWYNEQSARVTLYKLLKKQFSLAFEAIKNGLMKYHLIWLLTFCHTTIKIAAKRSFRFLHRKISRG